MTSWEVAWLIVASGFFLSAVGWMVSARMARRWRRK